METSRILQAQLPDLDMDPKPSSSGLGPANDVWHNSVIRNNIVGQLPKSMVAVLLRVNRLTFAECVGHLYETAEDSEKLHSILRAVRNPVSC